MQSPTGPPQSMQAPIEPPPWAEIEQELAYQKFDDPKKLQVIQTWGKDARAFRATLPGYKPEHDQEVREFVAQKSKPFFNTVKPGASTPNH